MIPSAFHYRVATDVAEAEALLVENGDDAKVLAGGMSLIPLMKMRLAEPGLIVDIGRLNELRYVSVDGDRLRIGALTRHADLATHSLVRENLPLLAKVAAEVGDAQVRARGTIGGVMAHADSAGDYCTVAVMLDAEIVTTRRRIPAADFFVDFMTTPLEPDELVTEVVFPVEQRPCEYLKFRRRRTDWAVVGIGVQRTSDGLRIGLTNVTSKAIRGTAAETALHEGASAVEAAAAMAESVSPTGDAAVSADYKKALVRELTIRALHGVGVS